jgi:hypothetical protein
VVEGRVEGCKVRGLYLNVLYIYEVTKLIVAFCSTLYTPFRDPRIFECNLASTELVHTNGQDGKLGPKEQYQILTRHHGKGLEPHWYNQNRRLHHQIP